MKTVKVAAWRYEGSKTDDKGTYGAQQQGGVRGLRPAEALKWVKSGPFGGYSATAYTCAQ